MSRITYAQRRRILDVKRSNSKKPFGQVIKDSRQQTAASETDVYTTIVLKYAGRWSVGSGCFSVCADRKPSWIARKLAEWLYDVHWIDE